MSSPLEILHKYWGYTTFHPSQEQVIDYVISDQNCLALLPTGAGKSVCYQVPAMLKQGLCVVISPLIALMHDQVEKLKSLGIKAQLISSGMSRSEISAALDNAQNDPAQKFLYISPERIQSREFMERFKHLPVCLIAVDEAHCISQWGYDFRPAFLEIPQLQNQGGKIPLVAVTATATSQVQEDICQRLKIAGNRIVRSGFGRGNIDLVVDLCQNKRNRILEWVTRLDGSGIIYAQTRRQVTDLASYLQEKKVKASFYHAGLTPEERKQRQNDWKDDKIRVIVATTAFGMGIDKADTEFVLHCSIPENPESYFQESGRCGRSGNRAKAVLCFEQEDLLELENRINQKFPDVTTLRDLYEKLCRFLRIAMASGKGESLRFDFSGFCDKSGMPPFTAYHGFKILESLGHLSFEENVLRSSRIRMIVEPSQISHVFASDGKMAAVVQHFLRTHIGSFDDYVPVNEYMLAKQTEMPLEEVVRIFKHLSDSGYADYQPRVQSPFITFLHDRVASQKLQISKKDYLTRKEIAVSKMQKMLSYVLTDSCKSKFIQEYFGEENVGDCGICSSCRVKTMNTSNYNELRKAILNLLGNGFTDMSVLLSVVGNNSREEIFHCIRRLEDDGLVETNWLEKKIRKRLP